MTTTTNTEAAMSTWTINTYVNGEQEWGTEAVTPGIEIPMTVANPDETAADLAEVAWENTEWVTPEIVETIRVELMRDGEVVGTGTYRIES